MFEGQMPLRMQLRGEKSVDDWLALRGKRLNGDFPVPVVREADVAQIPLNYDQAAWSLVVDFYRSQDVVTQHEHRAYHAENGIRIFQGSDMRTLDKALLLFSRRYHSLIGHITLKMELGFFRALI